MTKRCLVTICFALFAVSAAPGQEASAARSADAGPSLEVTMKFIQEKLNEQGKLNYVVRAPDQPAMTFITEMSNVIADPAVCRLTYHIIGRAGTIELELHAVRDLSVMTEEQFINSRSTTQVTVRPPISVIVAHSPANSKDASPERLYFRDSEMANRVAKAMVHAVELCGGGSQPEPF